MCLIVGSSPALTTSSSAPSSPPSSATVFRTTATSLPMNSPTASMKAATEPARGDDCPAPGCSRCRASSASSSAASSMPSRPPSRTPSATSPICAANSVLLTSLTCWPAADADRRAGSGRRRRSARGRTRATASSAPPDEQRHPPGGDVVRTAADRRVDDTSTCDRLRRRSPRRCAGFRWCAVTSTAPGGIAATQIVVQADLPDLFVGEHAHDDDVGARRRRRPASADRAAHRIRATAARFSVVRPSARTSWPASTSRRTIGAPMRPAPTKPTCVIAGSPSTSARRRRRRTPRPRVPTRCRRGSRRAGRPSAAVHRRSARGSSRVPPNAAMLPSALLVADPRVTTSHSLSRGMPRDSPSSRVLIGAAQVGGEQQVVQDLGDLAAAQRTEVDDRVGVCREHRTAALDDVVVAADHDQQLPFLDGGPAAAHRGVDHRNTLCRQPIRRSRGRCRDARCCGWRRSRRAPVRPAPRCRRRALP